MAWKIEFLKSAAREFDGLDRVVQRRVLSYFNERVLVLDDPRQLGAALTGTMIGYWKYRVGDYRVICSFEHHHLVIVVVAIDHRREIYR